MKFWSGMFWSAALFNFIVAIIIGFFGTQFYDLAGFDYQPTETIWRYLSALLIGMYGVGYALCAINPTLNRNIIILGLIGKLFVVLLVIALYAAGDIPVGIPVVASGDLIYVILFFIFLLRTRTGSI